MDHKEDISPLRGILAQTKGKMEGIAHNETELQLAKQLYIQHKVNEEQTKLKLHQQKEIEEAIFLQNQREKE